MIAPRERVLSSLAHEQPDRVPVDFLATPEIWEKLRQHFGLDTVPLSDDMYSDPVWENILHLLEVDCRVISYDQFCSPPDSILKKGAKQEWWNVKGRSTPARMWRQKLTDGTSYDIFGRCFREEANKTGSYEVNIPVIKDEATVSELASYPWPDPDWWDFSGIRGLIARINTDTQYHIRFRLGAVFEVAWQLRGLDSFLMDLALSPAVPRYMMERLTDIYVENLERVFALAGDTIDMVYFYDDVATQNALMLSKPMWEEFIKPHHQKIIDAIKKHRKTVIYHCDGAVYDLLADLVAMGVEVLNPIQADAPGMDPLRLKKNFGDVLSFHGGIDIIKTLPMGSVDDVRNEVRERIAVLGKNGGYIMASSHHIQSDTPLENVLAMYDVALR